MDANKRQYGQSNNRTSYIEGNTVRKLNAVPEIRREEQRTEIPARYREETPRRQEQRAPKALSGMNFASLLVLTIAIITTVYVCVEYLQLQTKVTTMNKNVTSLESTLKTLTDKNDAEYASIDTSYDLDEVYRIAVEEYGMVYPNNNEVITYQPGNKEYVRQYEDIPKN